MVSIRKFVLSSILIILLSTGMGVFVGLRNTGDYQIKGMQFESIDHEINVYRDDYGVPTIVAKSQSDLFFAQGYEMARDRLWQLEFFRSIANGELSRLFGQSQLGADKYLKTLSMLETAEKIKTRLGQKYLEVIQKFVDGINKYIELHSANLPVELVLINAEPKKWTVTDVIAIQGVLSRTLSISALDREFLRQDLAAVLGPQKAEEIFPVHYRAAENYYLNLNQTNLPLTNQSALSMDPVIDMELDTGIGSNNWVVGPNRTESGNPLLSNDPHLRLTTPGIWWQVNLIAPNYHVEGYSLPGVPGIIVGHNEYVTWGVTNTNTDAVDTFYFKTRNDKSQYYHDGQWKDFEISTYNLELPNGSHVDYEIKRTEYGPVLDPDIFRVPEDRVYVMRWAFIENFEDDRIFKSFFDLNVASNAEDIHEALSTMGVPGQNFVYATIDGDFGYQMTGFAPKRITEGSGVIPQNGSSSQFGWDGHVDYERHYRVKNPDKGYFATANQEIDPREQTNYSSSYYVTDFYETPFRGDRINQLLEKDSSMTIEDMKRIQGDTYNLYAKMILDRVMSELRSAKMPNDLQGIYPDVMNELNNWNFRMDRDEIGAAIFGTFKVFFEELTFKDELEAEMDGLFARYASKAKHGISAIINFPNSTWWDDVETEKIERRSDIVKQAIVKTIRYLDDQFTGRLASWTYGDLHKVTFAHPIGSARDALGFLNEGGIASDGSDNTVNAAKGTPGWKEGGIDFTQTHGPSMRYTVEVEATWSNVWGIVVPGEHGQLLSRHRGDSVKDWVNNILHPWNDFDATETRIADFTYRKS